MPFAPPRLAVLVALSAGLTACSADVHRFPLRDPIWKAADLAPISLACRADGGTPRCAPAIRAGLGDAASRLLAVDSASDAVGVNSVDEVPDSAWFTNRIGLHALTPEDIDRGPCGEVALDPSAPDGAWLIDRASLPGGGRGFRVDVPGLGKFALAIDGARQPERAIGAAAIASRLYHAAGYWTPCASIVHVRPAIFQLAPGLTVTDERGATRPFDAAALAQVLASAPSRDGLARLVATRALPGQPLGPFRYEGTRGDDPSDVLAHEDRRDLRGARVLAAWLAHARSDEQSTQDTWIALKDTDPLSSPGLVRHYQVGLEACFGQEASEEDTSPRLGHGTSIDLVPDAPDPFMPGYRGRSSDRLQRSSGAPLLGSFGAKELEPDEWQGGYPNAAFARMRERDGAWAARAIARFTPELVEAAVRAGEPTLARQTDLLIEQILLRQKALLQRYFARLSPVTDVRVSGEDLCGVDLARSTGVFPDAAFSYRARQYAGPSLSGHSAPAARPGAGGSVCLSLAHVVDDGGPPDDSPSRYVVVDIGNGVAPGPLRAHLYDLGPNRGFRLVGIERPDDDAPPE